MSVTPTPVPITPIGTTVVTVSGVTTTVEALLIGLAKLMSESTGQDIVKIILMALTIVASPGGLGIINRMFAENNITPAALLAITMTLQKPDDPVGPTT
jgi:hypothetical protein